jgi:hypothetical protein
MDHVVLEHARNRDAAIEKGLLPYKAHCADNFSVHGEWLPHVPMEKYVQV